MEDRSKAEKGDGESQSTSWTVCPCNNCSGNLEFDSAHAGETVKCPHCEMDTVLFIPQVSAGPPEHGPVFRTRGAWLLLGVVVTAGLFIAVFISPWTVHVPQHKAPTAERQPATNRVIEGLFGVKLGEPLPTNCIIKSRKEHEGLVELDVTPPVPNPALSEYAVELAGKRGLVASIHASSGTSTNGSELLRLQSAMAEKLRERYGDEDKRDQGDDPSPSGRFCYHLYYIWNRNYPRTIVCSYHCSELLGAYRSSVSILCKDSSVERSAEDEKPPVDTRGL